MKSNILLASLFAISLFSSANACCPPDDPKAFAEYVKARSKGDAVTQSPAQTTHTLGGWKNSENANASVSATASCACKSGSRSSSPVNTQTHEKK
jgi:hypothetical protein